MKRMLLVAILFLLPGCAHERSILVVDTVSGANFQWFFKRNVVPAAERDLEVKVDYLLSAIIDAAIPLLELGPGRVPNASRIEGLEDETVLGRRLGFRALPFWRSQMGLIYNAGFVADPPESWRELVERAGEWHDRIGLIRPDAKSSGGRRFVYGFLAAMGVDMSLPLDSLTGTREWKNAWTELGRFAHHVRMPMGEAPFLFQQFKREQVWLSVYSMDYTLWARDQGFLPPDLRVAFLEEGMPAGADAYLAVPSGLPREREQNALSFVQYLLSDGVQRELLREMHQYPSVDITRDAQERLSIPAWEDVKEKRVELTAREVIEFIRENATSFLAEAKEGKE
jgi:ABC-type uncharacterized transport system YnjBCD substrate-binding protein